MAKSKPNTVTAYRNGKSRPFPKAQWDNMVATKSTYGWSLEKGISNDSQKKDKEIETSQVSRLEGTVKSLTEENVSLKSDNSEKDKKIQELEGTVKSLTEEVEKLKPSNESQKGTSADKGSKPKA